MTPVNEPTKEARRLAQAAIRGEFKPEALHAYTNERGEPIYWRIRARLPDGSKWIRPMRRNGHCCELGEPDFPNSGKPLYRLHDLAAKPGAACWWVEGEQKADALAKLGVLASTGGGATSDERANFAPLKGRAITIWPDNDAPGVEHAARVAAKLRTLGCNVEMIDAGALGLPEAGDVVNWLHEYPSATAADLAALPRVRRTQYQPRDHNAAAGDPAGTIVYRRASDIRAKPIRWLWQGRIARGKVSMLAGNPGLGKSQVTVSMAAVVSTGGTWPVDRTRCGLGNVIFLSAEDDPADTIRPRLEASGADLSRVFILDAVIESYQADGDKVVRAFNLAKDMERLSVLLAEIGDVALIVIDPITAYLGETDSHKNAEIRALLSPLSDLAAKHGTAVVCVSHLNKSGGGEALMRVTGSMAFVAAARAAFIVAKDQENEIRRLFLPLKNNIGNDQTGLAFALQSAQVKSAAGLIETSRVIWEPEAVTLTADEVMAPQADPEERSATDEAQDWLRTLLDSGPAKASEVQKEARQAGISDKALRRARERLGVKPYKREFSGGWWWGINGCEDAQDAQDAQSPKVGTFEVEGHLGGDSEPMEVEI